MRLVPGGSWTALVACPPGRVDAVAAWADALGAKSVERDARDPLLLRVRIARLPPTCEQLVQACRVHRIDLAPDGTATVGVTSGGAEARAILAPSPAPEPAEAPALTPRQAELLQFCLQRGYYNIPRRTTLRRLSAELGISPTSLSLALRRAEAKLMGARSGRAPAKRAKRPQG